ncbi:hypothetical protein C2S53_011705 [Perilla frutescens var. hirtella]|uniref:Peptidase metallopeptidase domain-containing protein n=1 Tax=Perilla frutescens var. hirtella TaxID=608512 RepID=A0AAD4IZM1_PERFH|nr:hypothetical protein C2S53_011705 [Perilla frutescens var. hirtella]
MVTSFVVFVALFLAPVFSASSRHSAIDDWQLAYFKKYGYLEHARRSNVNAVIASAITTFQQNFGINPTGILDVETVSAMEAPRCGVPDIINGTNYMQPRNYSSKFTLFPYSPKWKKYDLKYLLTEDHFPPAAKFPLDLAFTEWHSYTDFIFSEGQGFSDSELSIGFYSRDHGDGSPFDGPGLVVGHAWPPENGIAHFDADENWSYDSINGTPDDAVDFETAALHEIGHMLGLEHSTVQSAVMFPFFNLGERKRLDDDDINGIRFLYGNHV